MSPTFREMKRFFFAVSLWAVGLGSAFAAVDRGEPPPFSRIALKLDNLLIVGNRISLAVACVVQTSIKDSELKRRGIDPRKWRSDYCAQSLAIVEPWARQFRRRGNFQLLPRGVADASLAKIKLGEDGEVPPEALGEMGRRLEATHLLLVEERITPRGNNLSESRLIQLVDLASGDVLAADQNRF